MFVFVKKALFVLVLIPFVLSLCSCAGRTMDRLMPQVNSMYLARHYFGEPKASTELADGTIRHEWVRDKIETLPGHYETRCIRVYYDRDGYRECVEREVWVPSRQERQVCRLSVIASKDGRVLSSSWEGNSCDTLPIVPPTY
ncbi:hypothetical protein LJC59_05640 [Desulfovibrio sp. OttesenSCG-928-A18]|nr:hypothetical protein [Desulfovibrio sp. OttesenSCG-928-A18]